MSAPTSTLEEGDKLFIEAVTHLKGYDYERAASTVQKIAKEEPSFGNKKWQAKAFNLYATFCIVAMQHDDAIAFFKKSLELDADYINSLLKLGQLLSIKESHEEGKEYFDRAISLAGEGKDYDVEFARATMMADAGDMEGAISLYEQVSLFLF